MLKNFLSSITHNAISLIGTGLAIAGLVLIICLFVMEQLGFEGGPYLGILTYLILPMIFVTGLILIPIGAVLYRRNLRRQPGGESTPLLGEHKIPGAHPDSLLIQTLTSDTLYSQ